MEQVTRNNFISQNIKIAHIFSLYYLAMELEGKYTYYKLILYQGLQKIGIKSIIKENDKIKKGPDLMNEGHANIQQETLLTCSKLSIPNFPQIIIILCNLE